METISLTLYSFDELDGAGKERAINDWRNSGIDYFYVDDVINSMKTFCQFFGVTVKDYAIGTCNYSWVRTDAENRHFRGLKLRQFSPDNMPTGYCGDYPLWNTFYNVFKASGDAKRAFNDAMRAWVKDTVRDMEYQESDEYIAAHLSINECRYTADGRVYY